MKKFNKIEIDQNEYDQMLNENIQEAVPIKKGQRKAKIIISSESESEELKKSLEYVKVKTSEEIEHEKKEKEKKIQDKQDDELIKQQIQKKIDEKNKFIKNLNEAIETKKIEIEKEKQISQRNEKLEEIKKNQNKELEKKFNIKPFGASEESDLEQSEIKMSKNDFKKIVNKKGKKKDINLKRKTNEIQNPFISLKKDDSSSSNSKNFSDFSIEEELPKNQEFMKPIDLIKGIEKEKEQFKKEYDNQIQIIKKNSELFEEIENEKQKFKNDIKEIEQNPKKILEQKKNNIKMEFGLNITDIRTNKNPFINNLNAEEKAKKKEDQKKDNKEIVQKILKKKEKQKFQNLDIQKYNEMFKKKLMERKLEDEIEEREKLEMEKEKIKKKQLEQLFEPEYNQNTEIKKKEKKELIKEIIKKKDGEKIVQQQKNNPYIPEEEDFIKIENKKKIFTNKLVKEEQRNKDIKQKTKNQFDYIKKEIEREEEDIKKQKQNDYYLKTYKDQINISEPIKPQINRLKILENIKKTNENINQFKKMEEVEKQKAIKEKAQLLIRNKKELKDKEIIDKVSEIVINKQNKELEKLQKDNYKILKSNPSEEKIKSGPFDYDRYSTEYFDTLSKNNPKVKQAIQDRFKILDEIQDLNKARQLMDFREYNKEYKYLKNQLFNVNKEIENTDNLMPWQKDSTMIGNYLSNNLREIKEKEFQKNNEKKKEYYHLIKDKYDNDNLIIENKIDLNSSIEIKESDKKEKSLKKTIIYNNREDDLQKHHHEMEQIKKRSKSSELKNYDKIREIQILLEKKNEEIRQYQQDLENLIIQKNKEDESIQEEIDTTNLEILNLLNEKKEIEEKNKELFKKKNKSNKFVEIDFEQNRNNIKLIGKKDKGKKNNDEHQLKRIKDLEPKIQELKSKMDNLNKRKKAINRLKDLKQIEKNLLTKFYIDENDYKEKFLSQEKKINNEIQKYELNKNEKEQYHLDFIPKETLEQNIKKKDLHNRKMKIELVNKKMEREKRKKNLMKITNNYMMDIKPYIIDDQLLDFLNTMYETQYLNKYIDENKSIINYIESLINKYLNMNEIHIDEAINKEEIEKINKNYEEKKVEIFPSKNEQDNIKYNIKTIQYREYKDALDNADINEIRDTDIRIVKKILDDNIYKKIKKDEKSQIKEKAKQIKLKREEEKQKKKDIEQELKKSERESESEEINTNKKNNIEQQLKETVIIDEKGNLVKMKLPENGDNQINNNEDNFKFLDLNIDQRTDKEKQQLVERIKKKKQKEERRKDVIKNFKGKNYEYYNKQKEILNNRFKDLNQPVRLIEELNKEKQKDIETLLNRKIKDKNDIVPWINEKENIRQSLENLDNKINKNLAGTFLIKKDLTKDNDFEKVYNSVNREILENIDVKNKVKRQLELRDEEVKKKQKEFIDNYHVDIGKLKEDEFNIIYDKNLEQELKKIKKEIEKIYDKKIRAEIVLAYKNKEKEKIENMNDNDIQRQIKYMQNKIENDIIILEEIKKEYLESKQLFEHNLKEEDKKGVKNNKEIENIEKQLKTKENNLKIINKRIEENNEILNKLENIKETQEKNSREIEILNQIILNSNKKMSKLKKKQNMLIDNKINKNDEDFEINKYLYKPEPNESEEDEKQIQQLIENNNISENELKRIVESIGFMMNDIERNNMIKEEIESLDNVQEFQFESGGPNEMVIYEPLVPNKNWITKDQSEKILEGEIETENQHHKEILQKLLSGISRYIDLITDNALFERTMYFLFNLDYENALKIYLNNKNYYLLSQVIKESNGDFTDIKIDIELKNEDKENFKNYIEYMENKDVINKKYDQLLEKDPEFSKLINNESKKEEKKEELEVSFKQLEENKDMKLTITPSDNAISFKKDNQEQNKIGNPFEKKIRKVYIKHNLEPPQIENNNLELLDEIRKRKMRMYNIKNNDELSKIKLNTFDYNDDDDEFNLVFNILELDLEPSNGIISNDNYTFIGGKLKDMGIGDEILAQRIVNKLYTCGFLQERYEQFVDLSKGSINDGMLTLLLPNHLIKGLYNPIKMAGYINEIKKSVKNIKLNNQEILNEIMMHDKKFMTLKDMKKILNEDNFLNNYDQFEDEVVSTLFYVNNSLTDADNIVVYRQNDVIIKDLQKRITELREENKKINEKVNEYIMNPKKLEIDSKNDFKILDEPLTLIDKTGHLKQMKPMAIASTTFNRFYKQSADPVSVMIMCKTSPYYLDKLKNIIEKTYKGTGDPERMIERYQKSLNIYIESNGEEQQLYHKKIYDEEFTNFMIDFNYINNTKCKMPKTIEEFLFSMALNNENNYEKLIYVNGKSRGNFTDFSTRDITIMTEIRSAIVNFQNLKTTGQIFFQTAFKYIAAKVKNEIHDEEKPPRFYNPTQIVGFLPFQYMLNTYFLKIKNYNQGNKHNLLGITNTGDNFSRIMHDLKHTICRKHYSDNFWISEEKYLASIDVERCDSNLSKEALTIPLYFIAEQILEGEDLENMKILIKIFGEEIPREAIFTIARKTIGRKANKLKEIYSPYLSQFFWLPSGVVGTSYLNHMYTGFFMYLTKNIKWFDGEGKFTPELNEMAKKFGIHLKISTIIDKTKPVKKYEILPFDLLGQSGMYLGDEIYCPLLEENRMWKSLAYMKNKFYDDKGFIASYIRVSKSISMLQNGASLIPQTFQACYVFLTAIIPYVKKYIFSITGEVVNNLRKMLEEENISLENYMSIFFTPPNVRPQDYILEKTGKNINPPPEVENMYQNINERIEKINIIQTTFAEVISREGFTKASKIKLPDDNYKYEKKEGKTITKYYGKRFLKDLYIDSVAGDETKRTDINNFLKSLANFIGREKSLIIGNIIIKHFILNKSEKRIVDNLPLSRVLKQEISSDLGEKRRLGKIKLTDLEMKKIIDSIMKTFDNLASNQISVITDYQSDGNMFFRINTSETLTRKKALEYYLNKINYIGFFIKMLDDIDQKIRKEREIASAINHIARGRYLYLMNYKELLKRGMFDPIPETFEEDDIDIEDFNNDVRIELLKIYKSLRQKGYTTDKTMKRGKYANTPLGEVTMFINKKREMVKEWLNNNKIFNRMTRNEKREILNKLNDMMIVLKINKMLSVEDNPNVIFENLK